MKPRGLEGWRRMYGGNLATIPRIFIILTIIRGAFAPGHADCPERCSCKWISGKNTALCVSAGFVRIPDLKEDTQVIDLKNNKVPYLYRDAFSSLGLVNLQKILISNSSLKEIHRDSFNDLLLLVEVDLSDNLLTVIPKDTFSQNERLKALSLSGNPLKTLKNEQFPRLPHLRTLDLENCQLNTIRRRAFANLAGLENLNLNSNRLHTITVDVFAPLIKLKSLALDANPWRCDCELKAFRNWYIRGNLYSVSPACDGPDAMASHLWENTIELDFSCFPRVFVLEPEVTTCDAGDNVTLHCHVSGEPEPRAVWLYNGEEISRSNATTTRDDDKYLFRVEVEDSMNKWLNLTIIGVSDSDAGEYACAAKNYLGEVSSNLTVVLADLPPGSIDRRRRRSNNYWFIFTGLVVGCLIVFVLITSTIACACMTYNRKRRRKHRRILAKESDAKGYYEQDKQLLDLSSSVLSTEPLSGSSELLNTSRNTLLKHPSSMSIDKYSRTNTARKNKETTAIIPLSISSTCPTVYPPPPEFSNGAPSPNGNQLGNIVISVSLDPSITIDRFPDLLDSHRGRTMPKDVVRRPLAASFATLPRRPYNQLQQKKKNEEDSRSSKDRLHSTKYDNMGRRVTAAGSSTLSLHRIGVATPSPPPPPPPPPPVLPKPDLEYM